eukprot:TRINITY_DN6974_c0_g1_i1.p1 TRINITY_DN6974_c0_g1~~TRINITY_DN6974_c0_g1_i1.p1  ORF type:complete len:710 (+),score=152.25 TRINITY_DN6974_c0_g1_i1:75-2204(+)
MKVQQTVGVPRGGYLATCAVILVTLLLYIRTLCPSVPPGDSGEMITSAYTMGVAHPPGYPLFLMIGKLFTLLPMGSVAWRVNLMSAVSDALAAGLLYLTAARWLGNLIDPIACAAAFAFTPLIWTYALVAEVFALNNFLISLLLYLALCFYQTKRTIYACSGAMVIGLGLCNQHTIVMYALPLIVCTMFVGWQKLGSPLAFAKLCVSGLVGLLPYLHLPLMAYLNPSFPPSTWGDHVTLAGILKHFLRQEYGTFQLASGHDKQSQWAVRLWLLAKNYTEELWYVGTVATVAGVVLSLKSKQHRPYGILLMSIFVFYLIAFNSLANLDVYDTLFLGVQARFWQQTYIIMYLWLALGVAWIREKVLAVNMPRREVLSAAVLILCAGGLVVAHYHEVDQHDYYMTEDWARAIIGPLPPDSLLLLKSDHIDFPIRYLQFVEGYRLDVQALDLDLLTYHWIRKHQRQHTPNIEFPADRYSVSEPIDCYVLKELLEANMPRMRVFLAGMVSELDTSWQGHYSLWAFGINAEFYRNGSEVQFSWFADNLKALQAMQWLVEEDVRTEVYTRVIHPWEYLIWRNLQEALHMNIDFYNQIVNLFPQVKDLVNQNRALANHMMAHFRSNHTALRNEHLQQMAMLSQQQVPTSQLESLLPPRQIETVTRRLGRASTPATIVAGIVTGAAIIAIVALALQEVASVQAEGAAAAPGSKKPKKH